MNVDEVLKRWLQIASATSSSKEQKLSIVTSA